MREITISGIDCTYNEENSYEKDGHIYCKKCHQRLDGEAINNGRFKLIPLNACECDKKRLDAYKVYEKEIKLRDIRDDCFRTAPKLKSVRFNEKDPNNKIYRIAKKYVEEFETIKRKNLGLLLYGEVGTGKTHLAAIIANEIIERYQINVKFRNIPEIINEIEKGGFELDKNLFIQNLSNTPLLILDDFGIERRTSYTLEYLYQIINSRYKSKLPTIISTNIHVEEMKMKNIGFSMERIYSRILEMCVPIHIFGENRREGKAETKNKLFYEMMKEEEKEIEKEQRNISR